MVSSSVQQVSLDNRCKLASVADRCAASVGNQGTAIQCSDSILIGSGVFCRSVQNIATGGVICYTLARFFVSGRRVCQGRCFFVFYVFFSCFRLDSSVVFRRVVFLVFVAT